VEVAGSTSMSKAWLKGTVCHLFKAAGHKSSSTGDAQASVRHYSEYHLVSHTSGSIT